MGSKMSAATRKLDIVDILDIPVFRPSARIAAGVKVKVDADLNKKISVIHGDITKLRLDAIVNAANSSLLGGGGVDGAIHAAAGPALTEECRGLGGCRAGQAKLTNGYGLPAKHVIHTVGPRGEQPAVLEEAYKSCLSLAVESGIHTLAFPCISTGVYGYPAEPAANVACKTVRQFLEEHRDAIDRVVFCCFLESDRKHYEKFLSQYFPEDIASPVPATAAVGIRD